MVNKFFCCFFFNFFFQNLFCALFVFAVCFAVILCLCNFRREPQPQVTLSARFLFAYFTYFFVFLRFCCYLFVGVIFFCFFCRLFSYLWLEARLKLVLCRIKLLQDFYFFFIIIFIIIFMPIWFYSLLFRCCCRPRSIVVILVGVWSMHKKLFTTMWSMTMEKEKILEKKSKQKKNKILDLYRIVEWVCSRKNDQAKYYYNT